MVTEQIVDDPAVIGFLNPPAPVPSSCYRTRLETGLLTSSAHGPRLKVVIAANANVQDDSDLANRNPPRRFSGPAHDRGRRPLRRTSGPAASSGKRPV